MGNPKQGLQRSPILRFALEVLQHALECYCSDEGRNRKIAVLNLAQAIELSVKAALVEKNVAIYEKGGGRTINTHDALQQLAKLWTSDRVAGQSRIELLIDERNAIQHRYGNVDDVTLDYHMQTAFDIIDEILRKEFDTELGDWIRDNIDKKIWERVRFVAGEDEVPRAPSAAIVENRPILTFVDGFSRYEQQVRKDFAEVGGVAEFRGSTLDVVIKALGNALDPNKNLIKRIPAAYKLRNRVIHGDAKASEHEVKKSLEALDEVLGALNDLPKETLRRALSASQQGLRGIRLPTMTEDEGALASEAALANEAAIPGQPAEP